jgi:FtsZ-binding cell division protein ZapB
MKLLNEIDLFLLKTRADLETEIEELKVNWAETIRSKEPLVKEINRLRKENRKLKEHYESYQKVV